MNRRIRTSRLSHRFLALLERERQHWMSPAGEESPVVPEWRQGYCEGLRMAQTLIRKGE